MIKFCHYIKINSFYNKYNICAFNKDIEGNPFIIRFNFLRILIYINIDKNFLIKILL